MQVIQAQLNELKNLLPGKSFKVTAPSSITRGEAAASQLLLKKKVEAKVRLRMGRRRKGGGGGQSATWGWVVATGR